MRPTETRILGSFQSCSFNGSHWEVRMYVHSVCSSDGFPRRFVRGSGDFQSWFLLGDGLILFLLGPDLYLYVCIDRDKK